MIAIFLDHIEVVEIYGTGNFSFSLRFELLRNP